MALSGSAFSRVLGDNGYSNGDTTDHPHAVRGFDESIERAIGADMRLLYGMLVRSSCSAVSSSCWRSARLLGPCPKESTIRRSTGSGVISATLNRSQETAASRERFGRARDGARP